MRVVAVATLLAMLTAPAIAQTARQGRCHMGECAWSKTLGTRTIATGPNGNLVELRLLGGISQQGSRVINWNAAPHTVDVYCSRQTPAVMIEDGGKYQVDVLPFASGIPGVLENSALLYMETCHNDRRTPTEYIAQKYGYSTSAEFAEEVPRQLNSPKEITRYDYEILKAADDTPMCTSITELRRYVLANEGNKLTNQQTTPVEHCFTAKPGAKVVVLKRLSQTLKPGVMDYLITQVRLSSGETGYTVAGAIFPLD